MNHEVQVFRLTLITGTYYKTAEYTRKEGIWPNETYYTTNELRYVGKFINHVEIGYGDGATHFDIFDNDGEEIRVYYSYEGTTCFVKCPHLPGKKRQDVNTELLQKTSKEKTRVKPLSVLAKYNLSSLNTEWMYL